MTKLANAIWMTVFIKDDEDYSALSEKFNKLVPLDLEAEKLKINEKNATGFSERRIKIKEIMLSKDRHIRAFLENLSSKLGESQKKELIEQSESRLDSEQNFFLRLDKIRMTMSNDWILTDEGNCFHIKISVAAFPKTRENALNAVKQIFK